MLYFIVFFIFILLAVLLELFLYPGNVAARSSHRKVTKNEAISHPRKESVSPCTQRAKR